MKNIYLIPTNKPSRVLKFANQLLFDKATEVAYKGNQHIYITNSEEINVGDWFLNDMSILFKADKNYIENPAKEVYIAHKKIILTDNKDLIKDGVQPIPDEFLEWFVKNSSCEYVEIIKESYGVCHLKGDYCNCYDTADQSNCNLYYPDYKITIPRKEQCPNCDKIFEDCKCTTKDRFNIPKEEPKTAWVGVLHDRLNEYHPTEYELKDIYQGDGCLPNFPNEELCQIWCDSKYKEEPKQEMPWLPKEVWDKHHQLKQETLEEVAKKYYNNFDKRKEEFAFIDGAKWQKEQDSNFTVKYIKSEMEFQIERMAKLGINTTGQCFEQMVNSLILLAERSYNEGDIIELIQFLSMNEEFNDYSSVNRETAKYFIEQFKKK